MGRVEEKVALITGGARGQGRSHAVTLAREGASIVISDICEQIPSVPVPMSTPDDLQETVRLVEEQDQRCIAIQADARSAEQMQRVVDRTIEEFGRIDIVAANHGICHLSGWEDTTEQEWRDSFETNVLGIWNAVRPAIPHMIQQGGGSIIMTSSVAGFRPLYAATAYTAGKHAVIGLMRSLAAELGRHWIRVNAVCPGNTFTPMNDNPVVWGLMAGGKQNATEADGRCPMESMNVLPTPWAQPDAISEAVLYLASDAAKHVTGVMLPVDSGMGLQPPGLPLKAATRLAELEDAARRRSDAP
jgi:SDR family mycofactocin-dependent oxidoreductase